ncbi:MAG: hypothetical protein RI894_2521 [Bacteroidota bacterium]|jgi:hypothetical protein
MFNNKPSIGRELLDVPMGEMIRNMAFAIAEAQIKLDNNSIEVAEMMGGLKPIHDTVNGQDVVAFQDSRVFFGKERISLSTAIDIYNNTNDLGLEGIIKGIISETNAARLITATAIPIYAPATGTAPIATDDHIAKTSFEAHYLTAAGGSSNISYSTLDIDKILRVNGTNKYYKIVKELGTSPSPDTIKYYEIKAEDIKKQELKDPKKDPTVLIPTRLSMLELGFSPTFYQFVDTIIEVKIAIKYTQEGSSTVEIGQSTEVSNKNTNKSNGVAWAYKRGGVGASVSSASNSSSFVSTSQVNASYSQKYSYSAEGSSLLRTKLVPIPPPAILEERIRQQMELAKPADPAK